MLAPSDVVYSTAEEVVIASSVWVDPAERDETFDDWTSAVHRFDVSTDTPSYVASGQVEGSIGNQFNFGEVGDRLAVVASAGTPWQGDGGQIDLTTFETEGSSLVAAGSIADLADGIGGVSGVRFTETRAFVSSPTGSKLAVIDLSDPDAPARTAVATLGGAATYIHPITPERVVALGSHLFRVPDRSDEFASAAHADLVDTTDPAAPEILGEWDVPYSSTPAATDHHAFLHWPGSDLMGFESRFDRRENDEPTPPPEATLVSTDPGLAPKASVRPQRVDPDPPCPTLDPEGFRPQLGDQVASTVVLDCTAPRLPDYPGRSCSPGRRTEDKARKGLFFCRRKFVVDVVRVLVVDGAPWLYTSESLELLDPTSFASTGAVPLA